MVASAFVAAVPAVPLVGGAALAGLALLTTIVGLVVGYGLYFAWRSTIGWLMHRLADLLDVGIAGKHPLRFASRALVKGSDEVAGAFLQIARGGERAGGALFGWAAFLAEWTAREISDTSQVTGGLFARLFHTDLPAVKAESIGAAASASAARARPVTQRQNTAIAQTQARVGTLERQHAERLRVLERGIDRVRTRDIPRVRSEARAAQRTATRTKARVESQSWWRTHIKSIAATSFFAAAVGTALGRLGLRWLRCGNVGRAGRAVCNMNTGLLEELLLGATALGIAFNLEEFAKDVQSVTDEASGIIRKIVT